MDKSDHVVCVVPQASEERFTEWCDANARGWWWVADLPGHGVAEVRLRTPLEATLFTATARALGLSYVLHVQDGAPLGEYIPWANRWRSSRVGAA